MLLKKLTLLTVLISLAPYAGAQIAGETQPPFVSGGIGEDSAAEIARISKGYGLKLLFASVDGHYLANVAVQIKDKNGNIALKATSEGPFFLVNLAPGKYEVTATYGGITQAGAVTLQTGKPREIVFRWIDATSMQIPGT